MEKIYVGKVVTTHGIKGEIRIISDFPFKDKVFVPGKKIIIRKNNYIINSYRVHKKFDMITLDGYNDINEVLFLLKKNVYILEEDLNLDDDEVLDEELLTYKVINDDGEVGSVLEIFFASKDNKILRVKFNKEVLIPFNSPIITSIDKKNKCINVSLIDGM